MKKVLVTIGRQYGSGGHEIGERMAGILGIPFYDRELIGEFWLFTTKEQPRQQF